MITGSSEALYSAENGRRQVVVCVCVCVPISELASFYIKDFQYSFLILFSGTLNNITQ